MSDSGLRVKDFFIASSLAVYWATWPHYGPVFSSMIEPPTSTLMRISCLSRHRGMGAVANSALEEVYGILRDSYADVLTGDDQRRNDSKYDRKNYEYADYEGRDAADDDDVDDLEGDVWRILNPRSVPTITTKVKD